MTCLIECNGMTNAQQIKKLLDRSLIKASTCRLPGELTERGCSYAVKVNPDQLMQALGIIRDRGFSYRRVFRIEGKTCEEVII